MVTTQEYADLDEAGFGSWKFIQHVRKVDQDVNSVDESNELETKNCFAQDFSEPDLTAQRMIKTKDLRSNL